MSRYANGPGLPRLRLAPEYHCWPLWWNETGDNLDPWTLPLSPDTREVLRQWADWLDSWYNPGEPNSDTELPTEEAAAFAAEGRRLWKVLREELRGQYEVVYQP